MAIARTPDSGAGPEWQGPRPKLTVPQIEAVHRFREAGVPVPTIAGVVGVSVRTVHRYLRGTDDPVGDLFVAVVREASDDYGLDLTATQANDIGRGILFRLRMRGWTAGRPD